MPIRAKNLDSKSEGMKRTVQVFFGDAAAGVTVKPIFAAPHACVVEAIDVYTKNTVSANSSETVRIMASLMDASGSTLANRIANTSGVHSDTISANSRYRLYVTANNSLSTGQAIQLMVSAVCASISQALVTVTYVPNLHRESR